MGQALKLSIVLMAVLAGGAGFNYVRNEPLDADLVGRTYATLSDEDLVALVSAYQDQARAIESNGAPSSQDPTRMLDGFAPSDFQGKLQAFDRFQRLNATQNETRRLLLEQNAAVDALEKEQALRRTGVHREWGRIKRRLLTF